MDNKADKLWKKVIRDQQKRMKPGECLKYVRMVIDNGLISDSFGQEFLAELTSSQLKYEVRRLQVANCIIWERSVGQRQLLPSDAEESSNPLDEEWKTENQVLQIISANELQYAVKDLSLINLVDKLRSLYPDKQHTIGIMHNEKKKSQNSTISNALIEMQIMHSLNVTEIPAKMAELVALLRRFTKSIAEAPYKQQKSETLGGFKKYLANDKKQCVRVVGTNGFGRLWQQHLNRLPLVTLEIAESIISQYSCPKKLLEEYENNPNATDVIAELRISRGGPQPLQTDRRIGNVLSKKLHTIYNTRDPNALV
ncbi:crossover junction endonuclease EME1 [Teleopsis dalmanni]|uniref:crossover junction endonuclease EME1 n=1 Tax=Teleopsis dalmanni TaxID=139649 RepID=UPI0018CEB1CF|nr:crossover junction endonuclease EME1 [Teleopsis dalmanni]